MAEVEEKAISRVKSANNKDRAKSSQKASTAPRDRSARLAKHFSPSPSRPSLEGPPRSVFLENDYPDAVYTDQYNWLDRHNKKLNMDRYEENMQRIEKRYQIQPELLQAEVFNKREIKQTPQQQKEFAERQLEAVKHKKAVIEGLMRKESSRYTFQPRIGKNGQKVVENMRKKDVTEYYKNNRAYQLREGMARDMISALDAKSLGKGVEEDLQRDGVGTDSQNLSDLEELQRAGLISTLRQPSPVPRTSQDSTITPPSKRRHLATMSPSGGGVAILIEEDKRDKPVMNKGRNGKETRTSGKRASSPHPPAVSPNPLPPPPATSVLSSNKDSPSTGYKLVGGDMDIFDYKY